MTTLTREQLEDRLAALHNASLELVQDISLESLLHRIAVIASDQAGARYAAVGVLGENGELERFIPIGLSDEEIHMMDHPPRGLGLIKALMQSSETIRIADIKADPRSVGFPKHHPSMKSFLGIQVRQGNRALGQIYLTNKINGDEFSEDDQQVIETLASYAAIAISNARLYKQLIRRDRVLTRRNENLALLNQLTSSLASATDVDVLVENFLTQVMEYLEQEAGEIYLREGDSKIFNRIKYHSKNNQPIWQAQQFVEGQGMVGMVAKTGQANLVKLPVTDDADPYLTSMQNPYNQLACFPLNGRQKVLGVFCAATTSHQPMGELDMQFLSAISSWVGTAVENMRLNLQQRRLAILEERERIGMDLHDGVIQSIYAVGLTLEHARLLMSEDVDQSRQRIEQAISDLNSTIRDIRAYILDLRPRQLHDDNLMEGMQRLVKEFRANTLIEVNLTGPGGGFPGMDDAGAVALFHICQEALANIGKHAHASHVDITVWNSSDRALIEVRDDGLGFDADNVKMTIGHGLANMFTRARNVGGDVEISSEPEAGTTIMAWVPITKSE